MQYAQQRSPGSNAIGIGLVVLLHLGVGYGLLKYVGWDHVTPAPAPMHTILIEPEKKVIEQAKPLPQPKPEDQKLDWVPTLDIPNVTWTTPIERRVTTTPPDTHELAPRPVVVETPAPPIETHAGAKRLAGPPLVYPRRPLALSLEGSVDVQCDVDDMGSTSNCTMISHEGDMSFVNEALDYVGATRYSPATRNGVPVAEKDHRFHITFKLSDR